MLQGIFQRISRFSAMKSMVVEVGMEKRLSHRLFTNLAIEYRLSFRSHREQIAGQATMKNISHGGAYLECPQHPLLARGQVGYFSCTTAVPYPDQLKIVHLSAKAIVRRIDWSVEGSYFGLAVEFLSGPLISYS